MPTQSTSLIIGANGFIGRALTTALIARGPVIAVERGRKIRIPGVRSLRGNIEHPAFARRISRDADVIYYLAAVKRNIASHTAEAFDYYEANVRPLLAFLGAIRTLPPKTIVYTSSVLVEYVGDDEAGADGYLQGKLACELALKAFARQYGWNVKILRVAAVYGHAPRRVDPKTANLIPTLLHNIRTHDHELLVWGTGRRKLQFIHLDDAVANILASARARGTTFTIGHPTVVTVDQLAQRLMRLLGKRLTIRHDASKPDKPTRLSRFTNIRRPKVGLEQGLRKLIADAE